MLAEALGAGSSLAVSGVVWPIGYSGSAPGRGISDRTYGGRILSRLSETVILLLVGNCSCAIAKTIIVDSGSSITSSEDMFYIDTSDKDFTVPTVSQ